jgi:hypothetical protein
VNVLRAPGDYSSNGNLQHDDLVGVLYPELHDSVLLRRIAKGVEELRICYSNRKSEFL